MKYANPYWLVGAGLVCAPFLATLLSGIIFFALVATASQQNPPEAAKYFFYLPLNAYYILPTWIGITWLAVSEAIIAFAWMEARGKLQGLVSFYQIVLLFYIVYEIWWFGSGQKLHHLLEK